MSDRADDERRRWDERYSLPGYAFGEEPCQFLVDQRELLPAGGRALDIAAGEGRDAVYLARLGFEVEAIDISAVGLRKAQQLAEKHAVSSRLKPRLWDLKRSFLPPGPFQLITWMHYMQRDLAPEIPAHLAPGGVLLIELATIHNLKLHRRPTREHLLQPNELIAWFPELSLLFYREGIFDGHAVAQLAARARDR